MGELGLLKWRPGGGNLWFLPGTPMDGKIANEFQNICRKIYEDHGLDYTVMNVCGPRFARGLHVITFNREDADERARADACYRKMSEAVGERGVFVGRAPIDYHDFHMAQAMPAYRDACTPIKTALDPNGRHRARPLRHRRMSVQLITRIGLPSRKARMASTVSP